MIAEHRQPVRSSRRAHGGPEFLSRLTKYVDQTRCRVSELECLCSAGHTEELAIAAIEMAGSSSEFGFSQLCDLAAELRAACEADDLDRADAAVGSIRGVVSRMEA